jgi:hypothetical protein
MLVPVADVGYTAMSAMFRNASASVSCSRETNRSTEMPCVWPHVPEHTHRAERELEQAAVFIEIHPRVL